MTLRAGSYLRLIQEPEMDLMDVVAEEAPSLVRKEKSKIRYYGAFLEKRSIGDDDWERHFYEFPFYYHHETIASENTHGLRFGNCEHRVESFTAEPIVTPGPINYEVLAHDHLPPGEGGTYHRVAPDQTCEIRDNTGSSSTCDPHYFEKAFGLVAWDVHVNNELWPGYPWPAQHIPVDGEGDLDVDEELVRAYDTIRPAITSDTSLLVTLAELKDVKSLFSEPISFANKVVHLVGRKRAKRMSLMALLKDPDIIPFIAKSLAAGKLYTEFGLKQTQRDVCSLYSMFFSLDRIVRDILSGLGDNTRHYSIPLFQGNADVFEHRFQDHNWIISRLWNTAFTRKFVCTIKYRSELVDAFGQPISPDDTDIVKIGAALDTLGVNLNPSILWDLVPFSFVVDYFVGVGDWLEQFKRNNLNLTFSVKDSCYSVKKEWITEGTTRRWTSSWNGENIHSDHPLLAREDYIGGVKFSAITKEYVRQRFVPTLRMRYGTREPDWRSPNIGQLKIMASLLTQNIPLGKTGRHT